ncbi:MAG: helix-turn-helix domain-containing protein [Ruminococcaceae bacterium]|jgi:transcriptional regulator with XRE-family HTH domain|nr:helix-turn-helix domain-containing protein [Oscillospiraceae bacterium]
MDKNEFSERLYKMRTDKGLSQKELGDLLGVSNKAISKWENGEAMPKTETMLKLAEIMNIDGNELLGISFVNEADKSYEKEINRLKIENIALKNKIDNQSKQKRRYLITLSIIFAVVIASAVLVLSLSGHNDGKKEDISCAGQNGTEIVFSNSSFIPCDKTENALLVFNKDMFPMNETKKAAFVFPDKTEKSVNVDCSSDIKLIRLRVEQGDFYYIDKNVSLSFSLENISSVYIRNGSIANNPYYSDSDYTRLLYSGTEESDEKIKVLCEYLNNLPDPIDKHITELFLGRNGKTVKINYNNDYSLGLETGEFFEDKENNLYFYSYADGLAYEAGKELSEIVNR